MAHPLLLIITLEWGTNLSKEKYSKGFTHCFVLTFVDEKDLDAYVKHADHQAFAKDVLGLVPQAHPLGPGRSVHCHQEALGR
jgi:hypothetical protein